MSWHGIEPHTVVSTTFLSALCFNYKSPIHPNSLQSGLCIFLNCFTKHTWLSAINGHPSLHLNTKSPCLSVSLQFMHQLCVNSSRHLTACSISSLFFFMYLTGVSSVSSSCSLLSLSTVLLLATPPVFFVVFHTLAYTTLLFLFRYSMVCFPSIFLLLNLRILKATNLILISGFNKFFHHFW